jgi:hypothetical protein
MVLLASPRLALQAGTIAGVYIDKLLPPWMLTMLLTVALIFIASKTARRACDRRLVCAVLSMDIARTTGRLTGVWGWLSTPSLCQSSHCGVPCAVGCGARTQRGWLSVPSRSVLSALPPTLPAVAAETRRPAGVVVVAAAAAVGWAAHLDRSRSWGAAPWTRWLLPRRTPRRRNGVCNGCRLLPSPLPPMLPALQRLSRARQCLCPRVM